MMGNMTLVVLTSINTTFRPSLFIPYFRSLVGIQFVDEILEQIWLVDMENLPYV